jgi:hypothetical protein
VALAIDGSTQPVVTRVGSGALPTATFTPPDGALLLIGWAGNSTAHGNPSPPSITDSLGTPLTYHLIGWRSHANSPAVDGQAAMWWAPVGTGVAMQVSTTNADPSAHDQALKVWVITGADLTTVGATGGGSSASASAITDSYSAQISGGWGFLANCDWDTTGTQTAGTGTTVDPGDSGSVGTAISYGFARRSSPDDVVGSPTALNVNLPGASTNLQWVFVEVFPFVPYIDAPQLQPPIPPWLIYQLVLETRLRDESGRFPLVEDLTGAGALTASITTLGTASLTGAGSLTGALQTTVIEDGPNSPVAVHSATTTATTAAFSPQAGTLLVARVAADGSSTVLTTATVTDSGAHVWTLLKRQNTINAAPSLGGTTEVWCTYLGTAPGSITVTASWSGGGGSNGGDLVVKSVLNAAQIQPGATSGAGGGTIAPTTTLTPTAVGSKVYGAALDYTTNAVLTANTQTTSDDQFNDATNGDTWAVWSGAAWTTTLTSTTFGYTNASAAYNVAAAEIMPALPRNEDPQLQPNLPPHLLIQLVADQQEMWRTGDPSAGGGATINGTAALAGTGAITTLVTQGVIAAPVGAGTLTSPVTQGAPAVLTGAGVLTGNVTESVTATVAGVGTLTATVVQQVTATLTGVGTVNALAVEQVTASLAGVGAVNALVTQVVTATLTGAGTLSAATGSIVNGTATLTGAGSLTANATQVAPVTATGAGTLAAKTTQAVTVAPVGVGTLTALATQRAVATLAGTGVLTAATAGLISGTAVLHGAGVLAATGDPCHTPRPKAGTTTRPSTGTTAYALATTARPNSGTTTRPGGGALTEPPCGGS